MAQIAVIEKCDLCEGEENVNFFCADCDEILCSGCKVGHSKSKATRNHKIIPLSRARNENIVHKSTVVYCRKHSTIEVTLFCLTCNQDICSQCLIKEHNGHSIADLGHIRDSKTKELKKLIGRLQDKKPLYENVFQAESQGHSQFLQSLDQAEKDIKDQKSKIIEELNTVCKEQFSELSKLRQNEEKRYSAVCNKYQSQSQTVTSTIQAAQKSIASNDTVVIIKATVDTTKTLDGLENPTMQPTIIAMYHPGDRSRPNIRQVLGKINTEHRRSVYQPVDRSYPIITQVPTKQQGANSKLMKDVHTVKHQEQTTRVDSNKQQDVNKPRIDINKVRVKSTITVCWGIDDIHVIVPLKNKTAWVKSANETQLSLLDSKGHIITKSVKLGKEIIDAKEYQDGLLVTYFDHCNVIKLSADGKSASTFSDLSPFEAKGLCVVQDLDVMVCLWSTYDKNHQVVRLNSKGDIMQKIQHDVTGAPLYKKPRRVTALATGEVIVVDWSEPRRIIGVDSKGQHLFTWEGEVQGRKLDIYSINGITHDGSNNVIVTDYYYHRVYVLGKNGSGAMCLLDKKQGIFNPQPVALDNEGQLWVGCSKGKIHKIHY